MAPHRTGSIAPLFALLTLATLAACTGKPPEADADLAMDGAERALAALPGVEVVAVDADREKVTIRDLRTGALSVISLNEATAEAMRQEPTPIETPAAAEPVLQAEALPEVAESPPETTMEPAIERDRQGRISRIDGPGYSVQRVTRAESRSTRAESGGAVSTPSAAAGERRRLDAVVCGAGQSLEINGAEIRSSAAGVVALNGCRLTLSNSRIIAGNWGLIVNEGATVRLDNTVVEGAAGSLDVYPGGTLAAWASTFRGAIGRPLDSSGFRDLGGNLFE